MPFTKIKTIGTNPTPSQDGGFVPLNRDTGTVAPSVPDESAPPNQSNNGIIGRLKSFYEGPLSDINLGQKIGAGLLKGLVGNTAKTLVQMPQSVATGALGLADAAGIEGAGDLREQMAKPMTVPVLGEVKPLSANPMDTEAANPKEALGQAVGILPEAALFGAMKIPGADKVAKTALGKLAVSFGVGAEYGGLSGLSQAAQADKPKEEILGETIQSALVGGLISSGLTAASMVPSGELMNVPKDIGNLVRRGKQYAIKKLEKLMPHTTGMRPEDARLLKDEDMAPRILERLQTLRDRSGSLQEAQDQLKQTNLERFQDVYKRAKKVSEEAYQKARTSIEKTYGAKTVGGKDVLENSAKKAVELAKGRVELGADNVSPAVYISGDDSGSQVLSDMYRRIQKSGTNPNVRELFELKDDLHMYLDDIERGGRTYRAGALMLDTVDSEINRLTADKAKDMNMAYRSFKEAQRNLKPIWNREALLDTQMNFVKNLESQAKSGSRKALKELETIAGMEGYSARELEASRIAKLLISEKGITGPRQLDDIIRTGFTAGPAAIGAMFGPVGAGVGALAGGYALKTLQSPAWWADVMFRSMKDKGIDVTADQVVNIVNSPLFQQTLQTMMQNVQTDDTQDQTTEDFYAE